MATPLATEVAGRAMHAPFEPPTGPARGLVASA